MSIIGPTARANISFRVNIPSGGSGVINIPIPDHSFQLNVIALTVARISTYMVTIAESIQLISDPKGGIKIKDALDPYQYEIITKALEANDLPAPSAPPAADIKFNPIGGTIVGIADLAGLAGGAAQLTGTQILQKFYDSVSPDPPIITPATGSFPDYIGSLTTIHASLEIISSCLSVIARSVNNSVDIPSKALLLKGILSAFQIALTEQASDIANRDAPQKPDI